MCQIEHILVPFFRGYDPANDPEFENGPQSLPITVEGLVEPPYSPAGVQKAAGSVLMACNRGTRFAVNDSEYGLFMKNDVSMGDIGFKVAQGLQKRIKFVPLPLFSNVQSTMTVQMIFYPLPMHANPTNTNNAG